MIKPLTMMEIGEQQQQQQEVLLVYSDWIFAENGMDGGVAFSMFRSISHESTSSRSSEKCKFFSSLSLYSQQLDITTTQLHRQSHALL